MNKTLLYLIAILISASLWLPAIADTGNENKDQRPYIVTTTAQISDIVKNIVGENARVEHIMGTGVDPHLYRPTRTDVAKLMSADAVFYNGMNLEGKMEHLFEQLKNKKPTYSVASFLDLPSLNKIEDGNEYDPHVWMDVENWIKASDGITEKIVQLLPQKATIFNENNDAYKSKLQATDTAIRSAIKSIPQEQKILVTAHDAFSYLGTAYDIEVIGIQGISTESEAGLSKISEIVNLIVERKVPAIFIETSVGDHNIKAIIEGARAKGHDVTIGGELYSDAMGTEGTLEGTYIGMMTHNANTIASALGGKPTASQQQIETQ